jgi:hypothetical protein
LPGVPKKCPGGRQGKSSETKDVPEQRKKITSDKRAKNDNSETKARF